MGLLREGEGVAARVLETLGADQAKIRTQVRGRVSCIARWCCTTTYGAAAAGVQRALPSAGTSWVVCDQ